MNEMEKMIWTAAFVAVWNAEREFICKHGGSFDDIPAFSCGERADCAVEKYREALECDDKDHLLPIKEKWPIEPGKES